MNYIILDLEWDSAYFLKEKRFINQIIQIGAVKLNDRFEIIDTFEVTVKSDISKKVSGRFSRLTGITSEMMQSGIPLFEAFGAYNRWVGSNHVTMTWSNSDLYTIVENERLLANGVKFYIEKYIDLQCFVQNELKLSGTEINSQISLANAAQISKITIDDFSLHTAKDDSLICAELLKKYYNEKRFKALIKDTRNPEFFERLCFKSFYIRDIDNKNIDRKKLKFECATCGKSSKRVTEWKYKNPFFVACFYCKNCDKKFFGKVSFRKTYDSVIVKKYTRDIPFKSEEGADNEMQHLPAQM